MLGDIGVIHFLTGPIRSTRCYQMACSIFIHKTPPSNNGTDILNLYETRPRCMVISL